MVSEASVQVTQLASFVHVYVVFTCSELLVHEVYVRFSVSQAVSSGLCPGTCVVPSRSESSDLDTLTPVFELYVRLRERRQWDSDSSKFEMADSRDWSGGGDDPEENTQHMIERIWESLTDIRARMDQQAPVLPAAVPPVVGGAIPEAPVSPPPGMELPFVPPSPPVTVVEEPVMQVEKFLRLQPPTYTGGPNPNTTKHWIHEIERVFTTMRCPAADKVVLATYQLRGFTLEWWRLKMQTTFVGRTEETITSPEFLNVFNDTFFLVQVQQVKREQFRTLQQAVGRSLWGDRGMGGDDDLSGKRQIGAGFAWELSWGSGLIGGFLKVLGAF
ncbi:hypothetical protein Taro_049581 [Colocasia esculenta]|uniref:Retrotransposon gag domain-containing protein n=1 Tax=Colocasia esculenta TaxID=4460 RepID=A0A843XBC7_COLES|nr:hypothetical protein [Colocasia esculenta]